VLYSSVAYSIVKYPEFVNFWIIERLSADLSRSQTTIEMFFTSSDAANPSNVN